MLLPLSDLHTTPAPVLCAHLHQNFQGFYYCPQISAAVPLREKCSIFFKVKRDFGLFFSTWGNTKTLSSSIEKKATCIACRSIISGVFRYGRCINKVALDHLELKFAKDSTQKIIEAEREYERLSQIVGQIGEYSTKPWSSTW